MPDYTKSSSNRKQEDNNGEKEPKAERRIPQADLTGEVIVKKHGLGRKFKDLVVSVDIKSVAKGVFRDVIVPFSAKMAYDAWSESGKRILFPHEPRRPIIDGREVQRAIFDYRGVSSNPISRASSLPYPGRPAPPREIGPRSSSIVNQGNPGGHSYLFASREDAARILEILRDALEQYQEPISFLDLYEAMRREDLIGPTDKMWGWTDLSNVRILQTRDGYLLDFPRAEALPS